MDFKDFVHVARKADLITNFQKILIDNNTLEELEEYFKILDKHKCDVECTGVACEDCTIKRHYSDVLRCIKIIKTFNDCTKEGM